MMDESTQPQFPNKLYYLHNPTQEVPQSSIVRLEYLYNSILGLTSQDEFLLAKSTGLIHILSQNLVKLFQEQQISIPVWISEQFCTHCSCFLVAGMTFQVRSKRCSRNRGQLKGSKAQLKNVLIMTCMRCGERISQRPGFERNQNNTQSSKLVENLPTESPHSISKNATNTPNHKSASLSRTPTTATQFVTSSSASKFSFLNKLSSITNKSSLPSQPQLTSQKRRLSVPNGFEASQEDFIPLGNPTGRVNLLDIEKANKKKKKRSSLQ